MSEDKVSVPRQQTEAEAAADLLEQYGCGPIRFSGHNDALYERHLLFDDVVDPLAAGARERFEAAARSVRDVLSQRWVRTERTYNRLNPKRIYYLSMEFLIGRSLDQQRDQYAARSLCDIGLRSKGISTGSASSSKNPMPGSETAGSGGSLRAFSTRWRRCNCRRWATGCATNTACSGRSIEDGWQREHPDNWLRRHDPWEVARPNEAVEIKLGSSFENAPRAPGDRPRPSPPP